MRLTNGTSALSSFNYDEVSVNEAVSSLLQNEFFNKGFIENGTFFITENNPYKLIVKNNGKVSLPYNVDLRNQQGNLVWVCPLPEIDRYINTNCIQPNILQLENDILKEKVTKFEALTYTLQTSNLNLKWELEEKNKEIKEKEETLMNIFKEAPFNYFIATDIACLLIGTILLLSSHLQIGAVFMCVFLVISFFFGFSLWSLRGIALLRPQFMVSGFVGSLGLLITAIGCLLV